MLGRARSSVSRACWLRIAPLDAQETTVDSSAKIRRTLLFPEGNIYRYILSIQPIHKEARLDVGSIHSLPALLSRQNPQQAKMIRMVLEVAESIDVCSLCGDSPAQDYRYSAAACR
jgi:hypothetical protein